MNITEYRERRAAKLPIESARELVHALSELKQAHAGQDTHVWYLLNRYIRHAMEVADREESSP